MIFIKLHSYAPLCERVNRTPDSAMQTQGQGHTSMSCDSAAGDLVVFQTAVLLNLISLLPKAMECSADQHF